MKGPTRNTRSANLNTRDGFDSNTPQRVEIFVQPVLAGKLNGTPYEIAGKTKPFRRFPGDVFWTSNLQDLDLPYYLAYLPF